MSTTMNLKNKLIEDAHTIKGDVSSYMIIKADSDGRVQIAVNASLQESSYLITNAQAFVFNYLNGDFDLPTNENIIKQ